MKRIRRGTALLLSLTVTAFSAAAEAPSSGSDPEEILRGMTTREKICQMLIPSFRVWKEVPPGEGLTGTGTVENAAEEAPGTPITSLNDEIRECLQTWPYGGVTLFRENCADPEQTLRLISEIQTVNREAGGLPMLIGADQEGGNVSRMAFASMGTGNMALSATGDKENARRMAAVLGEEMRLVGFNADYAPVADVNNNPANPVIGVRSFSDDPLIAAEYAAAFTRGLHDEGIIATAKHFPGHGNTETNSHSGFPVINISLEELRSCELIPFRALVEEGVDMIMTAHIQYPLIEKETRISVSTGDPVHLPATMSRTILQDLLRDEMNFDGLIISDSLDMAAIKDHFNREDTLTLTVNAGVNLLILPAVFTTEDFRVVQEMTEMAVRLAEEGKISMEAVDDSVLRILKLKKEYGILDRTDFEATEERIAAALSGISDEENRKTVRETAERAVTLLDNETDAFPLRLSEGDKTAVFFSSSCGSRSGNAEWVREKLLEAGVLDDPGQLTVWKSTKDNGEDCLRAAEEADHVILVYRTYQLSNLREGGDDADSIPVFREIIQRRHEKGGRVILISAQLPYDAALFPEADARVLCYNSGEVNASAPEEGPGSGWIPNLAQALLACFGQGTAEGKLPVNLYAIGEDGQFTEEIIHPGELTPQKTDG